MLAAVVPTEVSAFATVLTAGVGDVFTGALPVSSFVDPLVSALGSVATVFAMFETV